MAQSQFVQCTLIGEDEEMNLGQEEENEDIYGDGEHMEDEDYIPAEDAEDDIVCPTASVKMSDVIIMSNIYFIHSQGA